MTTEEIARGWLEVTTDHDRKAVVLWRQQPLSPRGAPAPASPVPRGPAPAAAAAETWGEDRAVIAKARLDSHPTLIVVNTSKFTNGIFLSVEVVLGFFVVCFFFKSDFQIQP